MMAGMRMWLLSIVSVSLLCALADALMPRGAVKRVGGLVCGLVLAAAVLAPLARLDLEGSQRWLEGYFTALEGQETQLKEQVDTGMKAIIEQEYAAYIVDKAAQMGLACTVQVECLAGEDGLYLPVRAELAGNLPESIQAELARVLEEELGLPRSGQSFINKEGAP